MTSPLRRVALLIGLAAAYAVAGKIGLEVAGVLGFPGPLWPTAGLGLAALLAFGASLWPGIALGAFVVGLWGGSSVAVALGLAAAATLEAAAGALLVRKIVGRAGLFETLRSALIFVTFGCAVAPALGAALATGTLLAGKIVDADGATALFWNWWLADALGTVLVAPLLLGWGKAGRRRALMAARLLEIGTLTLALAGLTAAVFGSHGGAGSIQELLLAPVLGWAALRFGPRGAALASALVSSIALVGAMILVGPAGEPVGQVLPALQIFLGLAAGLTLVAASAIDERDRALAASAAAERRASVVAGASALLAEAVSLDELLDRLGSLLVPELADWCTILIHPPGHDDRPRRVAAIHRDARRVGWMEISRERLPPSLDPVNLASGGLVSKKAELLPVMRDADLVAAALSKEHLRLLRELGVHSAIAVPLFARGQTCGMMSLLRGVGSQAYQSEDLGLIEQVAACVALVLDDAQLHEVSESSSREREERLAVVRHELKSPLAAIATRAKLIDRWLGKEEPASVARQSEGIRKAAQKAVALIDNLMDADRLSDGNVALDLQRVPVHELVGDLLMAVEGRAKAQGVALGAEVGPFGALQVGADRSRVLQVFCDALDDALRFSSAGDQIRIVLGREDGEVRFTIEHRSGQPPAGEARAFGGWQGRDGESRLGLLIVRQLIEAHGGLVSVDVSGEVSRYAFSLPLAVPARPVAAASRVRRTQAQL